MIDCLNENQARSLRRRLYYIDQVLVANTWLLRSYTSDYFTQNVLENFSPCVQRTLQNGCTFRQLASILPVREDLSETCKGSNTDSDDNEIQFVEPMLPLSMLCFQKLCLSLAIPLDITRSNSDSKNVDGCFHTRVKEKKQHEIGLLADVISAVCAQSSCSHVVDVGSGLGHLARVLSFDKQLIVTSVEAESSHTPKAQQLDRHVECRITKKQGSGPVKQKTLYRSHHVIKKVDPMITPEQFENLIQGSVAQTDTALAQDMLEELNYRMYSMLHSETMETRLREREAAAETLPCFDLPWPAYVEDSGDYLSLSEDHSLSNSNETSENQNGHARIPSPVAHCSENVHPPYGHRRACHEHTLGQERICLSGLHACGDLTPTLLKVFVRLPRAHAITSVSCCYHKISPSRNDADRVFPMSNFATSLPGCEAVATWEARELACHHVHEYQQRLKGCQSSLKRHAYRAALQVVLRRRPLYNPKQTKRLRIKDSEALPFKIYAQKAFARMGLTYDLAEKEVIEAEMLIESQWKAIAGFYTMRLALAPLVEAYILLDRMLFLAEKGIGSRLRPVFDPRISPRNHVLIAIKGEKIK